MGSSEIMLNYICELAYYVRKIIFDETHYIYSTLCRGVGFFFL